MAFLSPFEHDIFISYARVDDKTPGQQKGWVSLFHEYLEIELSKRFGRFDTIKIWRDTREMGGNTLFDEKIQTSIHQSAIFLALTSRSYLSKESYCPKELNWFHEKAQSESYGLKIGTRSRLFNLFLQSIPYNELPDEFEGTSGFIFHDAERSDEFGVPSHQNSALFEKQIRKLVDEIEATLREFYKFIEPPPPDPSIKTDNTKDLFPVFLAHAADSLRTVRKRVIEELRQHNIQVIADIPPPYEAHPHEQKVIDAIGKVKLSVHLFDDLPGMEIDGEAGKSYSQKQVEIGRQYAKSQWIWIPKALDIQMIEDENHKTFLQRLENGDSHQLDKGARKQAPYSFIRESSGSITREILAEIEKIKRAVEKPTLPSSGALLDTHFKDQLHALDLSRILLQRPMRAYINPEEDEPQKNDTLFQEMLKKVSVLIIIFGEVADYWVRERLNNALQIATAEKYPLKLCGIYLAPINTQGISRQVSLGVFPGSIPIFLFDKPEMLSDLLDKFVGGS